mmetsp:Transcript_57991/g.141711  ORF Transcript_57991/g.141711 Transcript_57991/m.141711 type:complete len:627 (-) Transcript_57991:151-2031(-)
MNRRLLSTKKNAAVATSSHVWGSLMVWAVVVVVCQQWSSSTPTTSCTSVDAFVIPTSTTKKTTNILPKQRGQALSVSSSSTSTQLFAAKNLVVVSPPGGVGEVAAVKAACAGSNVRWFVVEMTGGESEGDSFSVAGGGVSLSPQTLQDISLANGSLELAGATVEELRQGGDALDAVGTWCSSGGSGPIDGLVCTYDDGIENSGISTERQQAKTRNPVTLQELAAAVRLASKEAAKNVSGPRVAVLAAEEEILTGVESGDDDNEEESNGGGLLGSLLGKSVSVPPTLAKAISTGSRSSNSNNVCIVRHGELFGMPDSSPEFSPLVGGPKRQPVVTEEYTMRDVRVDPFVVSGNVMSASSTSRTCRQCLGEAASLFATSSLPILSQPVSISSQVGTDVFTTEQWQQELERVQELVASGQASTLFSQEMIVDDTERLADWLATKWAPAVLRTYDLAAIRTGARPVYATRPSSSGDADGLVEITWQELINFDSIMVGKMILQVTKDGLRATRGAGDSSKGFGSISLLPLPGEDVLVRRLAEAASQAVDKGLAKKAPMKKQAKATSTPAPVVTSLQEAGDVVDPSSVSSTATATVAPPKPSSSSTPQTGPRQAGARRSTPRSRGTKKKTDE